MCFRIVYCACLFCVVRIVLCLVLWFKHCFRIAYYVCCFVFVCIVFLLSCGLSVVILVLCFFVFCV